MINPTTFVFPQARLDQMIAEAARFDARVRHDSSQNNWAQGFNSPSFRRDAAETAFIVRQLEFIRPGIDEMQFPELHAQEWFPWDTTVDNGSESITTTQSNQSGKPKLTKDLKGEAPRVDMKLSQVNYPIYSAFHSYGYGIQEVRAAMKAGIPLTTKWAALCREQLQRALDDIAFMGSDSTAVEDIGATALQGALTLTGTDTYTVPADGAGASKTFESKDSDKILRDLSAMASQVVVATKGIENPETMLLPLATYEFINTKRVGDGTSDTVLSYFRRVDGNIRNVYRTHKSATAGSGSTKRVMVYEKNPSKLQFFAPVPFEQFPPGTSANGLEVMTVCHFRTAGMIAHRPKSIIYADGV